ncbi:MAG: hypothetical protein AB8H12_08325 [Lewinella sp.]
MATKKHISGITQTAHVHTYVTLGAICGNYYGPDFQKQPFPKGISFPYQQRPYTISTRYGGTRMKRTDNIMTRTK